MLPDPRIDSQMDDTMNSPIPQYPLKHNFLPFQGKRKDIRCDIVIKRGYGATSGGLQRPLSLAFGSCRPLESSNWRKISFSMPQNPFILIFMSL